MTSRRLTTTAAGITVTAGLALTPVLTPVVTPVLAQEIKLTFADQNSPTGWGPSQRALPRG